MHLRQIQHCVHKGWALSLGMFLECVRKSSPLTDLNPLPRHSMTTQRPSYQGPAASHNSTYKSRDDTHILTRSCTSACPWRCAPSLFCTYIGRWSDPHQVARPTPGGPTTSQHEHVQGTPKSQLKRAYFTLRAAAEVVAGDGVVCRHMACWLSSSRVTPGKT